MLKWHHVEDFKVYNIQYELDGYWHRTYVQERDIETDVPSFMATALDAEIVCEPEELKYR